MSAVGKICHRSLFDVTKIVIEQVISEGSF